MKQTQNRKGIILDRDRVTTVALIHVQELANGRVPLVAKRTLADQSVGQLASGRVGLHVKMRAINHVERQRV